MLRTRVITAVVLLAVLVAVLLYGGETGWNIFVLTVLAGAFWEWAKLGRLPESQALIYSAAATGLCVLLVWQVDLNDPMPVILSLAGLFWLAFAPWCLKTLSIGILANRLVYISAGFILIAAAGLAFVLSRNYGTVFLLSAVAICFAADIFAYIFGKTFGKRKLAPNISPGKSWEGAIGGIASVIALSWAVVIMAEDYPVLQNTWQFMASQRWSPVLFTLWLFLLGAYSIVGDLFESMLKRRADLKDSSHLLPGHGGILDRIDAQLPVLPLAVLLVSTVAV